MVYMVKSEIYYLTTGDYDLSLSTWSWIIERYQLVDFIQVFYYLIWHTNLISIFLQAQLNFSGPYEKYIMAIANYLLELRYSFKFQLRLII